MDSVILTELFKIIFSFLFALFGIFMAIDVHRAIKRRDADRG